MKRYYNSLLYLCLALVTGLMSCDDFGDMNVNPTKSSNMDPALQLALIQARFSGDLESNERVGTFNCMPMVQQLGGAWALPVRRFLCETAAIHEHPLGAELSQ